VKEESQLEDMRAALRGDRERAEKTRRRSTENVRALIESAEPQPREQASPREPRRGLLSRLFGR
jgi:hypothetical protein